MNVSFLACFATLVTLSVDCDKGGSATAKPAASGALASVPALPALPPEPVETPGDHIDKLNFADAVDYAKPMMGDMTNRDSPGALLLAVWATKHMRWVDVGVQKDETSPALVRKDPDEARAKRMCTSGQLVQIAVVKLDNGAKLSEGLLESNAGNLYHYLGAGSSGELVEQSYARFCGVVIGTYDYSNSAGGTGHAVEIVGMFDLPENRPTKPARTAQ